MVMPTAGRAARVLGFHEFKKGFFYRDLVSELVGTMILVFVSCALSAHWEGKHPSIVQISLAAGICIATIVWCLANASGSHINPAISIAFAVAGHITPVRALCYSISQCLGALLAVVFAKALTPVSLVGPYFAVNRLNPLLTPGQGVGMEAVCTFLLTFTVFATIDQSRHDLHGSGPLAIGFSVLLTHLFGVSTVCGRKQPDITAVKATLSQRNVYYCLASKTLSAHLLNEQQIYVSLTVLHIVMFATLFNFILYFPLTNNALIYCTSHIISFHIILQLKT